jgi:hypothetical protein
MAIFIRNYKKTMRLQWVVAISGLLLTSLAYGLLPQIVNGDQLAIVSRPYSFWDFVADTLRGLALGR